jgi:NAD(P)-dependent dehydrogenase (short-subunit alcohol dehydrogenase family)
MKNFLVVGSNSAIGQKIIDGLLYEGNAVYSLTRSEDSRSDANHHQRVLDIMQDELPDDFLPESIDGFIYMPGTINLRPFKNLKLKDFQNDFDINVVGAIKTLQWALKNLTDGSSVLFFSSVAVQTGMAFHSAVGISKGAIEGLTRSLAAELTPKVRVNCIAPSLTNTPMASRLLRTDKSVEAMKERHPLKEIGQPEDIANLALFLLSDKARWMTGQVIGMDGGMSAVKV